MPTHRFADVLALLAAVATVSLLSARLLPPTAAEAVRLAAVLAALLLLGRRRDRAVAERDEALLRAETLATTLPGRDRLHAMCSHCKGIREDDGRWVRLEEYLEHHFHAALSHGVCPECLRVEYPGLFENH